MLSLTLLGSYWNVVCLRGLTILMCFRIFTHYAVCLGATVISLTFKKKIRAILVCVLFFRCHSHFLLESLCIRKRKKNDWWLLTKLVTDCKNSQCLIFHLWVILFVAGRPKRGVFSGVFATRHEGRGHSNEGIPQWLDSIGQKKSTGEKILITCTLCETTTMM